MKTIKVISKAILIVAISVLSNLEYGLAQMGGTEEEPICEEGFNDPNMTVSSKSNNQHLCTLVSGGKVKCWGKNNYGQLGDGTTTDNMTEAGPTNGISGIDAKKVVAGDDHTCALLKDGTVSCWGRNNKGQLGDGSTTTRTSPVTVENLQNVIDIASGGNTTCALFSKSVVKCWGENTSYGKLGNNSTSNSDTPVEVE